MTAAASFARLKAIYPTIDDDTLQASAYDIMLAASQIVPQINMSLASDNANLKTDRDKERNARIIAETKLTTIRQAANGN